MHAYLATGLVSLAVSIIAFTCMCLCIATAHIMQSQMLLASMSLRMAGVELAIADFISMYATVHSTAQLT